MYWVTYHSCMFAYLQSLGLQEMWQQYGTGEKRRMLPLHQAVSQLGEPRAKTVIKAHILTGEDCMSKVGTKYLFELYVLYWLDRNKFIPIYATQWPRPWPWKVKMTLNCEESIRDEFHIPNLVWLEVSKWYIYVEKQKSWNFHYGVRRPFWISFDDNSWTNKVREVSNTPTDSFVHPLQSWCSIDILKY